MSIEDLQTYYNSRLDQILKIKDLIYEDSGEREVVKYELNSVVLEMKVALARHKEEMGLWSQQLETATRCLAISRAWDSRSRQTLAQIPAHALRPVVFVSTPGEGVIQGDQRVNSGDQRATKVKKVVAPAVFQVSYITLAQFDSIPKYMKGRAQYKTVNAAVDELNSALTVKYTFLARPAAGLKPQDKARQRALRSQDTKDTKATHFVTSEELRDSVNLKSETGRKNLLTILRHCNKIREIRGPGSIVRYLAVKSG